MEVLRNKNPDYKPFAVYHLQFMGGENEWLDLEAIHRWRIEYAGKVNKSSLLRQLNLGVENGYVEEHMGKYRILVEGVDGATLPGYVPCPTRGTDEDEA